MSEPRCSHGEIAAYCADCRLAKKGLPQRVWITRAGSVFHKTSSCEGILDGQRYALKKGLNTYDPSQVALPVALAKDRGACGVCFAGLPAA
jgi:hypothetical protein